MTCSNGKNHTKHIARNGVSYAGGVESLIDHFFFLCCLEALTLWCRLLWLLGIDWVPPRRVMEMLIISFRDFGRLSLRQDFLGVLFASLWFGPFGGKGKQKFYGTDGLKKQFEFCLFYFPSSVWASTSEAFTDISLSLILLDGNMSFRTMRLTKETVCEWLPTPVGFV